MIGRRRSRLENAEARLKGVGDFGDYERRRRFHYNLLGVSDAALIAELREITEGVELPDWAERELYAPIPEDADKQTLVEAHARAAEADYQADGADDDVALAEQARKNVLEVGGFTSLREAQWFWQKIKDEKLLYMDLHTLHMSKARSVSEDYV